MGWGGGVGALHMLAKSGLVVLGHGPRPRGDFYLLRYTHNLINEYIFQFQCV